jgi:hypothetical protein
MSPDVPPFIFAREGERWIPQPLATGPWYAGTMHGSAMLGLLARAIEGVPTEGARQVTRFTVDMMRAAPMAPLETPTTVLHAGRSSEFVEARIEAGGRVCARATALRLRLDEIDTSDEPAHYGTGLPMPPPDPRRGGSFIPDSEEPMPPAFHQALDFQPVQGAERPAIWYRMKLPLVEGESLTPFVRTAVIADWTYSVSFISRTFRSGGIPPARSFSAINPDTSVNLHRPLRGEWVGLDAQIHFGGVGAGTALAFVHDAEGPIGHSSQAVLLRRADESATTPAALRARALRERGQS